MDGPDHYTASGGEGRAGKGADGAGADAAWEDVAPQVLGPTRMKRRHLQGLGVLCRAVPYFEWPPEEEPARQVRARPQRHCGPWGAPPRC